MKADQAAATDIDQYIASFPTDVRAILEKVRQTIRKAAAKAEEAIKYRMPTFVLNGGNLVHFAGHQHHLGFYPTPSGIKAFEKELSKYEGAKGSVQFPFDEPIPYTLIAKITKFRVEESDAKSSKRR